MSDRILSMILPSFGALRRHDLPPGFSIRAFQPGDEESWLHIHERTGVYDPISPTLFATEFGDSPEELVDRQLFVVEPRGNAIATGTGWLPQADRPRALGRVHWIAVDPDYQRKGIGAGLVSELCLRLKARGYVGAYLRTGAANEPAISLYRSLGFVVERA